MNEKKQSTSFSQSIAMGALTIGSGIALKWLLRKENRQKLYNALEYMFTDSNDRPTNGKLATVKQTVQKLIGEEDTIAGKSQQTKKSSKK